MFDVTEPDPSNYMMSPEFAFQQETFLTLNSSSFYGPDNDDYFDWVLMEQSQTLQEPLPPGYTPYGEGGYYMRAPDGTIHLTPTWQRQVDSGELNWAGIAANLATIVGSGVSVISVWGTAVGMVIVAGADTIAKILEDQTKRRDAE